MANIRITREAQVQESVTRYVRDALIARGFPQSDWEFRAAYPYGLTALSTNIVAAGFTFDDGGRQFEIGSNFKERKYTIEFFVFGQTLTWAQSLGNAIKFAIEQDAIIPLLDITQMPPVATNPPEVLELDAVHARRQPLNDPEPWQEFVWYVLCQVTDYYDPKLT